VREKKEGKKNLITRTGKKRGELQMGHYMWVIAEIIFDNRYLNSGVERRGGKKKDFLVFEKGYPKLQEITLVGMWEEAQWKQKISKGGGSGRGKLQNGEIRKKVEHHSVAPFSYRRKWETRSQKAV